MRSPAKLGKPCKAFLSLAPCETLRPAKIRWALLSPDKTCFREHCQARLSLLSPAKPWRALQSPAESWYAPLSNAPERGSALPRSAKP
eukprot:9290694-Pyramimonas_sp.AAC.1